LAEPERFPAGLAVFGLKLGELQPAKEGSGRNSGSAGRLLNVAAAKAVPPTMCIVSYSKLEHCSLIG